MAPKCPKYPFFTTITRKQSEGSCGLGAIRREVENNKNTTIREVARKFWPSVS